METATLKALIKESGLLPQVEMLEIKKKKGSLHIGIPKETTFQERRVSLAPEAVSLLVSNGHSVKIETKSGENSNFTDNEYSEAGAEICYDPAEIYKCDIIFKVAPPNEPSVPLNKEQVVEVSKIGTIENGQRKKSIY